MEVQIEKSTKNKESRISYLPKDIYNALGLSEQTLYKLNLGQRFEYSFILPSEKNDKSIYLASSVFNKLLPLQGIILNIWKREDEINLGPVVGVFVHPSHTASFGRGRKPLLPRKHCEAGSKANCLCYYFSYDEIDWKEEKIKGYTFNHELNEWVHDWFPIPNVIYDRGANFSKEQKPLVSYMKKQFRNNNLHFINRVRFFNKWDFYKRLSKHSDVRVYLPKTIAYRNFNDVLSMLNKYNFIFIKAVGGTHGKQVLSIEQVDKKYKLNFYDHGLKEIVLEKIEDVKMFVERYAAPRGYLIQQGIRLIKYNGHHLDIRMLMVKDGQGKWEAASSYCRIAKQNFTITNCALGGDYKKFEDIHSYLDSKYSKKGIPDINELANATKKVLYYIEKEFAPFGELGVDMAIDTNGDIWLIEANTRPDKLTPLYFYNTKEIPSLTLNIFEYAKYLVNCNTSSKV